MCERGYSRDTPESYSSRSYTRTVELQQPDYSNSAMICRVNAAGSKRKMIVEMIVRTNRGAFCSPAYAVPMQCEANNKESARLPSSIETTTTTKMPRTRGCKQTEIYRGYVRDHRDSPLESTAKHTARESTSKYRPECGVLAQRVSKNFHFRMERWGFSPERWPVSICTAVLPLL